MRLMAYARRNAARILRGRAWISNLLNQLGITPGEFAGRYLKKQESHKSGLVYKWKSGKAIPSPGSVNLIAIELRYSDYLYYLPFFRLLEPRKTSRSFLRVCLEDTKLIGANFELIKSMSSPIANNIGHPMHHLSTRIIGLLASITRELAKLHVAARENNLDEFVASYVHTVWLLPKLVSIFPCIQFPCHIQEALENLQSLCPSRCIRIEINWEAIWSSAGKSIENSSVGGFASDAGEIMRLNSDAINVQFDLNHEEAI